MNLRYFMKKVVATWAKDYKNCTLNIIENAGHNSNQDNPKKVNELILKFI